VAQQRDPYQVLGVQRTASADEIKKAHRKLVRQYHPDRNPDDTKAEERFKEVQQAYDLLSDPDKRKAYDRGGFGPQGGGPAGGGGFGGFDTSGLGDLFNDLFGRGGGGGGSGGGRGRSRAPRAEPGRDLEVETQISFTQSIEGAQVSIVVPTTERCGTCSGTGARPGTSPKVCPRCQGRGVESQGQGLFSISQPCQRCGGSGTIIEDPCPTCRGEGRLRTTRTYRANIPAGVKEGSRVKLPGKGEPGMNGGPPGDLYVVVHVDSSPIFARKGDNVEVEVPLTVPEALQGAEIEVPTLDGRKTLRVPGGTKHGTVQRLRGEGPPKLGSKKERGDIHYRFVIDVPASLSSEQRDAVRELSKVMNGNPRSDLFAKVKGGA
jgi:molecular chaperone DnaJ